MQIFACVFVHIKMRVRFIDIVCSVFSIFFILHFLAFAWIYFNNRPTGIAFVDSALELGSIFDGCSGLVRPDRMQWPIDSNANRLDISAPTSDSKSRNSIDCNRNDGPNKCSTFRYMVELQLQFETIVTFSFVKKLDLDLENNLK